MFRATDTGMDDFFTKSTTAHEPVQAQSGLLHTHSGLSGSKPRACCCFRYLTQ